MSSPVGENCFGLRESLHYRANIIRAKNPLNIKTSTNGFRFVGNQELFEEMSPPPDSRSLLLCLQFAFFYFFLFFLQSKHSEANFSPFLPPSLFFCYSFVCQGSCWALRHWAASSARCSARRWDRRLARRAMQMPHSCRTRSLKAEPVACKYTLCIRGLCIPAITAPGRNCPSTFYQCLPCTRGSRWGVLVYHSCVVVKVVVVTLSRVWPWTGSAVHSQPNTLTLGLTQDHLNPFFTFDLNFRNREHK